MFYFIFLLETCVLCDEGKSQHTSIVGDQDHINISKTQNYL